MMREQPYVGKRGFTLLELLVVVAIIALLMGLLLPGLSRAREQAKATKCLSNLKQMVTAAYTYAGSNNDRFPRACTLFVATPQPTWYEWDFTKTKDWSTNPPKTVVTAGLLWQGAKVTSVQQCPSFDGASNSPEDPYTGYNYNTSFIGRGESPGWPQPAYGPMKTTELVKPATTAMFGDGQYADGANKFMRSPWPSPFELPSAPRQAGTQGFRHLGKTNVGWADGHAESAAKRYTQTDPLIAGQIGMETGFLSSDNSAYDPRSPG